MMPSLPQLFILLTILLVVVVIPLLVFGPVARKAGFSYWWGLVMAIPLVNLVFIWVFAFAEWPVNRDH